jgi:predicted membrane protein DUF2142
VTEASGAARAEDPARARAEDPARARAEDPARARTEDPARARPRRAPWLLAFIAFFLAAGAWSVAAPYDGTPDEEDHVLRAAGVAAGQVAPPPVNAVRGGGAFQTVPRSLVRPNCFYFKSEVSAACAAPPGGDATPVRVASAAGRYHPLYYALVGWPLRLWPDWTGILLARLVSAALSAALLATALVDAARWSRHRLVAAGVLAAATPMTAHMAGAVNPNGLEIAAGVAFFAAAVPLLYEPAAARSRALLWHAGVAALALATLRAAGPLWLVVGAVALLFPFRLATLRGLWAWRAARWWLLAVGLAIVASLAWTRAFKTTELGDFTGGRHWSGSQAVRLVLDYWREYADEMVGVTSWLDARMPAVAYTVWQGAVAALLVGGFLLAGAAGRWRLTALAAGGLGVPLAIQVAGANRYGFITQGRYLLPIAVGLPVLATFLIARYGLPADKSRSLLRLYALALLPVHALCLLVTMVRWQHGITRYTGLRVLLDPFAGNWRPPLGSAVPVLAEVAGLALLGWLVGWSRGLAPERPEPPGVPDRDSGEGSAEQVAVSAA